MLLTILISLLISIQQPINNTLAESENYSNDSSLYVGLYCCDAYGYSRCMLDGYYPIGTKCFCYGQGYGWVCR